MFYKCTLDFNILNLLRPFKDYNKISKHLWQIFGGILAIKDKILDVLISSFLGSLSWIYIENVLWKNYIRVSKKSYRIQKSPQGMESKFWTSFIVKLIRCLLEKSFMEQVGEICRQPIAVSDISVYICLIDIRDGSCKPVYGGVDRLQALSSAKTGCRSRFFMN